jgi:hypothetical protein
MLTKDREDMLIGQWRKFYSEKPLNFYSSLVIISMLKEKKMRQTGYITLNVEMTNACRILVGNAWSDDTAWAT